jgi:hypothetical protein
MTPDDVRNWEKRVVGSERIVDFDLMTPQGLDLVCPICQNMLIEPQDCI